MRKILLLSGVCLLLTSCFERLSDPSSPVEKGKQYLIARQWQEAISVFQQVQAEDPTSCDAAYGILLAQAGLGIDKLNSLLGFIFNLLSQGFSTPSSAPVLIGLPSLTPRQTSTGPVDSIVNQFLLPFLAQFNQVESAVQKIEELRCTFYLDHYIIDFSLGTFLRIYIDLRGEWSVGEAKLIGSIFDMFSALDYLVLSLDLNVNLNPTFQSLLSFLVNCTQVEDIASCLGNIPDNLVASPLVRKLTRIAEGDFITPLRALGFLFDTSPNLLNWHPERYGYFLKVGDEFASALTRFADGFNILMNRLPEYRRDDRDIYDNIVVFDDKMPYGEFNSAEDDFYINAYNPMKPKLDIQKDNICYNIYLSFMDQGTKEDEWCKNSIIDTFIRPVILSDAFVKMLDAMYKWYHIFSGDDTESYITMQDIQALTLGGIITLPDVIGFKPQAWFTKTPDEFVNTVSPPRKWLPYYSDLDGDGYAEFVIEGEFPLPQTMSSYSCSSTGISYGDCAHFPSAMSWISPGNVIDLNISEDCVLPQTGFLIYSAPQDPSMGGALFVRVESTDFGPQCNTTEENYARNLAQEFVPLTRDKNGLYLFNKSIAIILKSLSGIIGLIGGGGGLPFGASP